MFGETPVGGRWGWWGWFQGGDLLLQADDDEQQVANDFFRVHFAEHPQEQQFFRGIGIHRVYLLSVEDNPHKNDHPQPKKVEDGRCLLSNQSGVC